MHPEVLVKTQPVIGEQTSQHPLQLRLLELAREDFPLQVGHELGPVHRAIHQRADVGRGRVEALVVAPPLVLLDVACRRAVHPREDHRVVGVVVGLGAALLAAVHVLLHHVKLLPGVGFHELLGGVFAFEALHPLLRGAALLHHAVALHPRRLPVEVRLVQICGAVPKLACRQRTVAVLLAAEVAQQRKQVLGVVFIHRRVGRRTNHDGGERAVAQEHHGHAQREGVDGPPPFLARHHQEAHNQRHEQREVHQRPGVEAHAEVVDEEQLKAARQLNRALDERLLHKPKQGDGHRPCDGEALPRERVIAEIVHHGDGRDGQQVEQVHPDGQSHQVRNQDDPLRRIRAVGHVFPLEDGPKHERRKQAGQRVDLALHRTEPERVAERVRQSAHHTRPQHSHKRAPLGVMFAAQPFGQVGDAPKQEEDRERTAQHRQHVGRQSRRVGAHGDHEEARQQHEERGARRVSHLEFVGGGDEFTTVPEARCGLHSEEVHQSGQGPHSPSGPIVQAVKTHVSSIFVRHAALAAHPREGRAHLTTKVPRQTHPSPWISTSAGPVNGDGTSTASPGRTPKVVPRS